MRRAAMLLVVACIAGCSGSNSGSVDAPTTDTDGPLPTARLTINWSTTPMVPGTLGSDREVDEVRLRFENFQILGDGNPSSAPNLDEYKVRWNAEVTPMPVVFADVPMGLYTSIVFQLKEGDGENAFEIAGKVETDQNRDFEIKDTDTLSVTVTGFGLELEAGENATIEVNVNLTSTIAEINFAAMDTTDGDYIIEKGVNPQIGNFRTRLANAFSVNVGGD